jgi:Tol biopolymer transport system component
MKKIFAIFVCVFLIATVVGASVSVMAAKGGGSGGGKPGGGGKDTIPADPEIAYIPTRGSDGTYELYVMNEDGSNRVVVYSTDMPLRSPCWNSEGTKIAFVLWGDIWTIEVSVVDGVPQGANPTEITSRAPDVEGRHYYSVDWSPTDDNKFVGMCKNFDYENGVQVEVTQEINLVNINGNTVTETPIITPIVESVYHQVLNPTFNPDGTKIAYGEYSIYADTMERWSWIWIIDLSLTPSDSGYKTTVFFNDEGTVSNLDWANTEDTIAFQFQPWYSSMVAGFYTIDIDFSSGSPVGGTPVFRLNAFDTSWSPDDSKMVYEGGAKGNSNAIFTIDLTTDNTQRLVRNAGISLDLDWSRI